ncbi:MAG: DUF6781 family protein [Burkholderiales bacterium]|nr:DUF6781 family protein [Burkholderiales bacterium]
MSDATTGEAGSGERNEEAQALRERVRALTAQMLSGGRLDSDAVREVARAMGGSAAFQPAMDSSEARAAFAQTVGALDDALQASARMAHESLQRLAARGADFSDNDLKEAFAGLQKLQADYVVLANRVADAASGNLRRELVDLALHAQHVGADASVRVAQLMSELAHRAGGSTREKTAAGIDAARDYGARMTLFTSGVLAGFADAMRQQAESKRER